MQRVINIDAIRDKARQLSATALSSALVLATMAPIFLSGNASAAQITNRSITLGTSKVSTSNTYSVDFYPTVTTGIKGIVIEFCSNSPLVGTSCTHPTGMSTPASATTITLSQTSATSRTFTLVSPTSTAGLVVATSSTAFTPAATSGTNADRIHTTFTVTNPSTLGTFYGRILTYAADTGGNDPTGYTSSSPGTHIDDGGTAMSTARQLTVNAKVQEQLTFCVGTVDNTVTDTSTFNTYNGGATQYCGGSAFASATPTVDLGPISAASASVSPVATASGGNNLTGVLLTQTNAFNGATLSYFAEQNSSSGRLKVAGASCSGSTGAPITDAGSSVTDQCFNSNATQTSFATASTEEFGLTALIPYQIGTTANLTRDNNYDGNGTAAGGFAWDQSGSTVTLATSTTVLDYEAMLLKFAAQTAPTTPTGTYTVTSTYVATGVF